MIPSPINPTDDDVDIFDMIGGEKKK